MILMCHSNYICIIKYSIKFI